MKESPLRERSRAIASTRPFLWAYLLPLVAILVFGCDTRNDASDSSGQNGATGDAGNVADRAEPTGTERVALGTFSKPAQQVAAESAQGRLPGAGGSAAYIPVTELFPGAARLDPGIGNPYQGDADAISAGEQHYAAFNCGGCHAPMGGGGMGPPLSDDAWIYGGEPAQIYLSIMHGRPEGMPAWSSMLPQRTAWELVSYIESLSGVDDFAAQKGFTSGSRTGRSGRDEPGAGAGGSTTGGEDGTTGETQADQ
ncbi:MAG TPA: c-type cytochrome [Woeseiaceae bacterium]|nr:c-type cytochrome [Woeseiaceae bacterium]